MITPANLTYAIKNTYRIPIDYFVGFSLESLIEYLIEYPIYRDSEYGKPVGTEHLRSPHLICNLWARGSYDWNNILPFEYLLGLPLESPMEYPRDRD